MNAVSSFAPIEGDMAHVLILGTMPGVASLKAEQYYAHPRNSFWKIISAVLGLPPNASYEERIASLQRSGIALWDVLESCIRPGSMDADIDMNSVTPNDIRALLQRQPKIGTICFNGSSAEMIFKKRVLPTLRDINLRYIRLPSTSPAHAALSFEEKVIAWRVAIQA